MEEQEVMVTIPADRYEELVSNEARVSVLYSLLKNEKTLSVPVIFRILGFGGTADSIEKEINK